MSTIQELTDIIMGLNEEDFQEVHVVGTSSWDIYRYLSTDGVAFIAITMDKDEKGNPRVTCGGYSSSMSELKSKLSVTMN